MTDIDLFGDDEHPAAYNDEPTAILHNDPEWHRFADWHLRKLGEYEDQAAAIRTRFIDAISQLEARMGAELEKIDKKIRWHQTRSASCTPSCSPSTRRSRRSCSPPAASVHRPR